jgi:cardiolipin synthase
MCSIPNILTTLRLILTPFFVFTTLKCDIHIPIIILVLSAFTDMLDGYVAKTFKVSTKFGEGYDPLVDKIMQISIIICLCLKNKLPIWLTFIMITKEIIMLSIGASLYAKNISVKSNWYGKIGTIVFYFATFFIMLKNRLTIFVEEFFYIVFFLTTLFPVIGYLIKLTKKF